MQINPAEFKLLVVDDVQTNVLLLKALLRKVKVSIFMTLRFYFLNEKSRKMFIEVGLKIL